MEQLELYCSLASTAARCSLASTARAIAMEQLELCTARSRVKLELRASEYSSSWLELYSRASSEQLVIREQLESSS